MIRPTLERVELDPADIPHARHMLCTTYTRPDGEELLEGRHITAYRKQIEAGYYLRLVWPPGTTREQVLEWVGLVDQVLYWRSLGVV